MIRYWLFLLISIFLITGKAQTQVRIAITDFENQSDRFHLDSWERLVPELLRDAFSASDGVTVVTRDRVEAIMKEQALSLSGMVDQGQVEEVGKLLQAEFIITGSILEINDRIRVSAAIIRIKTGEIKTESVHGPDPDYLEKMVAMLANNLEYQLTGTGDYKEKIQIKSSSIWYLLGTTAALTAGAVVTYRQYRDKYDAYQEANEFGKFDLYYYEANINRKWSIGLTSLAALSFAGTIYSLIQNQNAPTIYARDTQEISFSPVLHINHGDEYKISLLVHF
jgi:TolB-like protein